MKIIDSSHNITGISKKKKAKHVTQDGKQEESNSQPSNTKCIPQNINEQDVWGRRKKVLLGKISLKNSVYYSY